MKSAFFILVLLSGACTNIKPGSSAGEPVRKGPEILFLNYVVAHADDDSMVVRFVSKIRKDGIVKGTPTAQTSEGDGLKLVQISAHGRRIDSIAVDNPLHRYFETANPDGELELKHVVLDSTQLSIRVQLNPQTEFVSLEKERNPGVSYHKTNL